MSRNSNTDTPRSTEETEPTFRVRKFGADWCGPCQSMALTKVLERFGEAHPECEVLEHDTEEEEELSDQYNIRSMPTLIIEDADGNELLRESGALNIRELEALYLKAQKKAAK